MSRKSLFLLIAALVVLGVFALLTTLLVRKSQQEAARVAQMQRQASAVERPTQAPVRNPELAAQRELACVDRVIAGAVPESANVQVELERCSEPMPASEQGTGTE